MSAPTIAQLREVGCGASAEATTSKLGDLSKVPPSASALTGGSASDPDVNSPKGPSFTHALAQAERLQRFIRTQFDPASEESWQQAERHWRAAHAAREIHHAEVERSKARRFDTRVPDLRTWVEIESDAAAVSAYGEL